jgi:hypothetical protein
LTNRDKMLKFNDCANTKFIYKNNKKMKTLIGFPILNKFRKGSTYSEDNELNKFLMGLTSTNEC